MEYIAKQILNEHGMKKKMVKQGVKILLMLTQICYWLAMRLTLMLLDKSIDLTNKLQQLLSEDSLNKK